MVNYNTLKVEVTARLGNRTDINARLDRWINQAFFELLLLPRFSFFELDRKTTFPTAAGTAEYTLPTDLWVMLDLRDITNVRKLRRSHWQVFDRVVTTTGQPTRYCRFGNQIQVDPTPDGVYTIQLRYRIRPGDLSAGGVFDSLGTEWEEVIATMAAIKGFEALDQRDKAAEQRALLEQLMAIRLDVPTLEDADAETTIAPVLRYNY